MGNRARARSHETIPSSIRPVAEIAPLPSLADLAERIDLKAITVQPHTPGSASLDDIPEPDLVRALGATYHTGRATDVGFQPDVIVECTGVGQVITDSISVVGAGGIVCLTGVGAGGWTLGHSTADIAATMVLQEQGHRWQRQRQQTTLVQGGTGAGSGGCHVAGAPPVAAREAGGFHERVAPTAGRHQGGHPVRGRVTARSARARHSWRKWEISQHRLLDTIGERGSEPSEESHDDEGTRSIGRSPHWNRRLEEVGAVSQRTPVGHGARGLQRIGRRLELLHPRSRPLPRLPLGRRRHRRHLRRQAAPLLQPGPVERQGSHPQGAALRADQQPGQPRRGREGVLLLPR